MKDYYKILEIDAGASLEVLNNAYRALVRKYHPDLYHTKQKALMNERMREINEAYNTLSHPESRAAYDARFQAWRQSRPKIAGKSAPPARVLRNVLLWGIGTYVLVRFLLKPLLASGLAKWLLLGFAVYLLIRVYGKSARKS